MIPGNFIRGFLSITKLKKSSSRVKHFLKHQMHPLTNDSASILNIFIIKLNFHFPVPISYLLAGMKTRHEQIASINFHRFTTIMPGYPEWFHIQPKPQHFFLKRAGSHWFCLDWFYQLWREITSGFFDPLKLCLRFIDREKHIQRILRKLFNLCAVERMGKWRRRV